MDFNWDINWLSWKWLILLVYLASALYVHYRGKVRHSFHRQLTDHSTFLAPINGFIYLFSATPRKPILNVEDFPELVFLRDNWETIREEAKQLYEEGHIKAAEKRNDAGFNSFFRRGWKRFYLKWYEDFLPSAQHLCPKTIELLKKVPGINGAMFALLAPHSDLVRHRDPYAGSLRYHLGLVTPNSEKCRIHVDDEVHAWGDGQDVLFDETYVHYAVNETDQTRIILFCDVERPMRTWIGRAFNRVFSRYVMRTTATQNLVSDRVGALNKAFTYLYAIRDVGKWLKKKSTSVYYTVKFAVLATLLFWVVR